MPDIADKRLSSVDRAYGAIKDMVIAYRFKPGERINEVELAKRLEVSRTPLREALNRLVSEGFLSFIGGRGFFCREFKPREIYELYQPRAVLEVAAARMASEQATDEDVDELERFLDETGPDDGQRTSEEMVALDEAFHNHIMRFARNAEMRNLLNNLNDRIRFFRWIDMDSRRQRTQNEHRNILDAIRCREPERAAALMQGHIGRRLDEITSGIKEGYSRIYLSSAGID